MAKIDQDPRVQALEQAEKKLRAAQAEREAALLDLLLHGPYGRQQAAQRITGINRETLRLMVHSAEASAAPASENDEVAA